METKKPAIWNSLWFLWLTTTIIYLVGFYFFGVSEGIRDLIARLDISDLGDVATLAIGLFVPFGMFNATALIDSVFRLFGGGFGMLMTILSCFRLMLVFILILLMIYNNKIFSSFNDRPLSKFFLNLLILFIFTVLIDLVTWHDPRSILILFIGLH